MAGNKIYVQGNYVDVHDNEVVNLSIDKAGTVNVSKRQEERVQTDVPEVLAKSELWERLKQAGLIDDDGLREGTVVEIVLRQPDGTATKANMRLNEHDVKTLKRLRQILYPED